MARATDPNQDRQSRYRIAKRVWGDLCELILKNLLGNLDVGDRYGNWDRAERGELV